MRRSACLLVAAAAFADAHRADGLRRRFGHIRLAARLAARVAPRLTADRTADNHYPADDHHAASHDHTSTDDHHTAANNDYATANNDHATADDHHTATGHDDLAIDDLDQHHHLDHASALNTCLHGGHQHDQQHTLGMDHGRGDPACGPRRCRCLGADAAARDAAGLEHRRAPGGR